MIFVRYTEKLADSVTCVPEEWMQNERQAVGAAAVGERNTGVTSIADVHVCAGHPSIRHTLFFARREINRAETYDAVKQCDLPEHQPDSGEVATWTPGCNRDVVVFGYRLQSPGSRLPVCLRLWAIPILRVAAVTQGKQGHRC